MVWEDGSAAGIITPMVHDSVGYDDPGYVAAQKHWRDRPKPNLVSVSPLREGMPVYAWETPLWYVADNTFAGLKMVGVLTGRGQAVKITRWHPLVFEMEDRGKQHGYAPTYHEILLKLDGLIKGDVYYRQSKGYDVMGEYAWQQPISFEREDDMLMAKMALT